MSNLLLVGAELTHKTLWNPTILGVLVVASAIVLFCGSVYLLLATNLGSRLGFLVSAAALSGFMVLLSTMWMFTSTPLNSPRGRIPQWHVREVVDKIEDSEFVTREELDQVGEPLDEQSLGNLRPAVESSLVTATTPAHPGEELPEQPFAEFGSTNDFLTDFPGFQSYVLGGGTKNVFWHNDQIGVVQFCETEDPDAVQRVCDPLKTPRYAVLEYDYGSVRQPPYVYFAASLLLFVLSLLGLHWREKDERARARAESTPEPAPSA